uniref:Uncharacterized protein n=1 Tax=Anguilla anguilla TaxID=7936 RepID=A0A0E9R5N8_ANGAN
MATYTRLLPLKTKKNCGSDWPPSMKPTLSPL